MRLFKYGDFLKEKFTSLINIGDKSSINRIDKCVKEMISFLRDNHISTWDDFEHMNIFDRDIVNKLIDDSVDNIMEVKEVVFRIRIELSNNRQLIDYKRELEDEEEYERCDIIMKKISKK